MIITQFDIWLSKLNYGWKIEDAPEYLREELRKRLESVQSTSDLRQISFGKR